MSSIYHNIKTNTNFIPPTNWLQIKTIDMHTGGEALRVIVDGFPVLKGSSVLEFRRYCKEHYDDLRKLLMFEPRGHADMYGCLLLPPNDEKADFGIIFLHNNGYSTMCGHAIIAISTLAVNMKWISPREGDNVLKIDTPCGRISSYVHVKNGIVQHVRFHCVPSYVVGLDKKIILKDLGTITYDLAYGGAFYAYVDLAKNDFPFDLTKEHYQQLINTGMKIKNGIMSADNSIIHPYEKDLSFLYGTIFIDTKKQASGANSKNVCVFAEGEVDRCPTGSGVSGRMAIHKMRGDLDIGDIMTFESITGSVFKGSVVSEQLYSSFKSVIPQVEGTAYITGMQTFVFDPKDSIKNGFILR